jgi:hypothetical protein
MGASFGTPSRQCDLKGITGVGDPNQQIWYRALAVGLAVGDPRECFARIRLGVFIANIS